MSLFPLKILLRLPIAIWLESNLVIIAIKVLHDLSPAYVSDRTLYHTSYSASHLFLENVYLEPLHLPLLLTAIYFQKLASLSLDLNISS
jgi:hypothetical protein